jgi:hypothetical protein
MEEVNHFIETIRPILEALYFIASICLVTTVIIGIIQLRLLKKDLETKNKRTAIEKSLEYLNFFASHLLPSFNRFQGEFKKEVPEPVNTNNLKSDDFKLNIDDLPKEVIAELLVKEKLGLTDILNQLEFFSSAMLNGVAEEEMVYKPIANIYFEIIEAEHVLLSIHRSGGTPYENLMVLYDKWKKRKQVEDALLQKQAAELKINQIGDQHKLKPPIGL